MLTVEYEDLYEQGWRALMRYIEKVQKNITLQIDIKLISSCTLKGFICGYIRCMRNSFSLH